MTENKENSISISRNIQDDHSVITKNTANVILKKKTFLRIVFPHISKYMERNCLFFMLKITLIYIHDQRKLHPKKQIGKAKAVEKRYLKK